MSKTKRIRPQLLILFWVWAVLMFVVVDLFLNVTGFDEVRPRWQTYQSMRRTAHGMVGEPVERAIFGAIAQPWSLDTRLERIELATQIGELVETAENQTLDARLRGRAMRGLSTRYPEHAQAVLYGVAFGEEDNKVRSLAARYLARAGAVGDAEHLADDSSRMVRQGARTGLAELGTAHAARALLVREDDAAVALISNPEAVPALADAASTSAAACRALGNTKSESAVQPLVRVLSDKAVHPLIRAAAANALGRLGHAEALDAVTAARGDPHAIVVAQAKVARQRLELRN